MLYVALWRLTGQGMFVYYIHVIADETTFRSYHYRSRHGMTYHSNVHPDSSWMHHRRRRHCHSNRIAMIWNTIAISRVYLPSLD